MNAPERPSQRSVCELLESYAARSLSPVEVVEDCARRIDAETPALNAALAMELEASLEHAHRSERRWSTRSALPLDGVPFGIKDVIDTAGLATSYGTLRWRNHRPERDAAVVGRLVGAGAIPLLKTQTNEVVAGGIHNVHYGIVRNPFSLRRMAGGSSSGSAAAVAARWIPFALGTDAGGSIRCPSAYCGVTGLKTTHGSLPLAGVLVSTRTTDTVGPIARSAADAARVQAVLAQSPVQLDPRVLAHLRVGVPSDWCFTGCDLGVRRGVEAAIDVLRDAGAEVSEVELATAEHAWTAGWLVLLLENLAVLGPYVARHAADPGEDPELVTRVAGGMLVAPLDYACALDVRDAARQELEAVFRTVDVLAMPTAMSVAFPVEVDAVETAGGALPRMEASTRLTMFASLTGVPAISVPCGLDGDELPFGLQLLGPWGAEELLLSAGAAYQALTDHHEDVLRLPPLTTAARPG